MFKHIAFPQALVQDPGSRDKYATYFDEQHKALCCTLSCKPFATKKVALLLCGLEMEALSVGECTRWRTKPKVHLMEELIEHQTVEHGSPGEHWAYKDESWGMWLSHVTARRGGKKSGLGVALSSLARFRYMLHKLEP